MSHTPDPLAPSPAARPGLTRLAAIDLGSNSFHLLVANAVDGRLQVVARRGEKVQLAAGLDETGNLDAAALDRAMACLSRFAPFVSDIVPGNLRVVGTNALRDAANSEALIERAEALLGCRVEIIAGREEARLIYLGAAHSLAENGRRLIVDIGGGSTEFIIGERFEPLALESLQLGCVTYTRRFFADGAITEKAFHRAELAAHSELANILRPYRELGWEDPVGSSGTIKAAAAVIAAAGDAPEGVITRHGLDRLRQRLVQHKRVEKLDLTGLKADRARVFPAGVAILRAIFTAFELESMRYADGALREGVLYDMVGRNSPEDTRLKTLEALEQRYGVDPRQARHVAATATALLAQVRHTWALDDDQARFLAWAARLHEIGQAISHSQFHRHGAYLLEYSDLAGFSRLEQRRLAFLVRAHRRKFPVKEWQALPAAEQAALGRLARLLRLAVLLNHARPEQPPAVPVLSAEGEALHLCHDAAEDPSLLHTDLEQEAEYQAAAGFTLTLG
ncbi:exopolyphosphatase [Halomonas sp. NO4]|uniref:exopolyphosphatase n=1 Tax=Halomonas sp. NO4 TaxID=2484813 RepID=UPI0013D31262|nr:exopolyphosphatase [Halomonas sp. NO4]